MLTVTFADLRYRYRQFLIAVVGAGVVLAMGILLAGVVGGFRAEINRTVGGMGADRWVLSPKAHGRLTSVVPFPAALVDDLARVPGVKEASGVILLPQEVVRLGGKQVTVAMIGVDPHGIGAPVPDYGDALASSGQLVVDRSLGAKVGDEVSIGRRAYRVVGLVHHRTLDGGMPVLYATLRDAQVIGLGGRSLVTAAATEGVPSVTIPQASGLTNSAVESATLETLASAISSILASASPRSAIRSAAP